MRMKLQYELQGNMLDLDYRRMLLSFIKKSLTDCDEEFYKDLYENNSKMKHFTFSVSLNDAKFTEDTILLAKPKFEMRLSTADYGIFVKFYNSLLKQKNKSFNLKHNNILKLSRIFLENETKISSNDILISFASPLVVRNHIRETNKDNYYIHSDEMFNGCLKTVIKNSIKEHDFLTNSMVDSLVIEPVLCKFVLIKSFGSRIPSTLGTFRLKGDARLLKHLFDDGIGSRRGEGFGMFNLV